MRQQQQHPFRIRTVTAFLQLPPGAPDASWEAEVAAAGSFLAAAQQHLESRGYEVQTVRIATQPFSEFLPTATNETSSSSAATPNQQQQPQQQQQQQHDVMVANAVRLEALAARHGIPLVSLGSTSDPPHLDTLPDMLCATSSTSCTFALPPEPDWGLCHRVAGVMMQVAARTGGMGNFRFGSASNMQPGIPYFPVACCGGPQQHRTFAIGTEADALLHQAFSAAAAAAASGSDSGGEDGTAGSSSGGSSGSGRSGSNILALAQVQLHQVLLQHWAPLEAAALEIEQLSHQLDSCPATTTPAAAAAPADKAEAVQAAVTRTAAGGGGFRYLGLDTSLAPGLDTPPLTDSYNLLLQGLYRSPQPASSATQAAAAPPPPPLPPQDTAAAAAAPGLVFGGPGSLSVSAMITRVLKSLPLKLTGYCGLMLAVCEDQGLAAAAAAGSITISQLLQYSAVCGCGLDTVPVPGPAAAAVAEGATAAGKQQAPQEQEQQQCSAAAAAAARDAETTAAIAGLVSDVNTLAYRLNKPLACRLLPLPGKCAGDATDFSHPYMINSRVMDLHK